MLWLLIIVLMDGHHDRFVFPTHEACQTEEAMQQLHPEVKAAVCVPNTPANRDGPR